MKNEPTAELDDHRLGLNVPCYLIGVRLQDINLGIRQVVLLQVRDLASL